MLTLLLLVWSVVSPAQAAPKFGPAATPLSIDSSYLHHAAAPDYWKLAPYYAGQREGWACSVASTQMVVNASRDPRKLTAADELATHKGLLEHVKAEPWHKTLKTGVTLDELAPIVAEALKSYGVEGAQVEAHHAAAGAEGLKALRAALAANEKSSRDFIVANFLQGELTGDPEGGGHIAPVGAYDAAKRRALVMDPDRAWYEPYWVSDETLLKAMATKDDASGKTRGWVVVKLPK